VNGSTIATYTANHTLVLGDAGTYLIMNGTNLNVAIPAHTSVAFTPPTLITIININSTPCTVSITTDTLTLANSTTTGTRSIAQNGICTLVQQANTSWLAVGAGVS
jgi:hypothetical protein